MGVARPRDPPYMVLGPGELATILKPLIGDFPTRMATAGPLVLCDFRGLTRTDEDPARRLADQMRALALEHPRVCTFVRVRKCVPPSPADRRMMLDVQEELGDRLVRLAIGLEDSGFHGLAVRAVMSSLRLMGNRSVRALSLHPTLETAVRSVAGTWSIPTDLGDAIADFYSLPRRLGLHRVA